MNKLTDFEVLCYSLGGKESPPYYRASHSDSFSSLDEEPSGGARRSCVCRVVVSLLKPSHWGVIFVQHIPPVQCRTNAEAKHVERPPYCRSSPFPSTLRII
ncbi:hypothetical protein E2C01_087161 [Portunus trituberculatus]|uniref:Uncharacterized protein n=1 Tax=Portunus trituberculatus TaxID=210409 RepID=A0A5B7JGJ5_PORTR|nr:hypothetical protein [Portunus trituberculatus]